MFVLKVVKCFHCLCFFCGVVDIYVFSAAISALKDFRSSTSFPFSSSLLVQWPSLCARCSTGSMSAKALQKHSRKFQGGSCLESAAPALFEEFFETHNRGPLGERARFSQGRGAWAAQPQGRNGRLRTNTSLTGVISS